MNNNEGDKKNFMREKIPSMKRRSVHNDYYGRHIYMLTLAVEGRKPILGKLVGNIKDESDPPRIELSPLGEAVQVCWKEIPKYHPEANCLALQIMPDHIHGVLFIERNMEEHLRQIVSGFKAGCNKAFRTIIFRGGASEHEQTGGASEHKQKEGSVGEFVLFGTAEQQHPSPIRDAPKKGRQEQGTAVRTRI